MPSTSDRALLILGCSAAKRHDAGALPAIDRYDGPAYRVLRKSLRERARLRKRLDVWILSAEFGLIPAAREIPDYDRRMTPARACELFGQVQHMINALRPLPARVYVDLGRAYRPALPPMLEQRIAWAMGGIGYRLGQLKAWLWGLEV